MTTSTWPKTGPCRTSYTICPRLVQAPVSAQCDNAAAGQRSCCTSQWFRLFHIEFIRIRRVPMSADLFSSFLSRSASVCPADCGQNNRPPGDYW